MRARLAILVISVIFFSGVLTCFQSYPPIEIPAENFSVFPPVSESNNGLHHGFITNEGQIRDSSVHYYLYHDDWIVQFRTSSVQYERIQSNNQNDVLTIQYPGAYSVVPSGVEILPHKINYFLGNSSFTGIDCYNSILFENIYEGVSLHYYLSEKGLKYDFLVNPGADPNKIRIQLVEDYEITVEDEFVFVETTMGKELLDSEIVAIQDTNQLEAGFRKSSGFETCYQFLIPEFDSTKLLIIDPLVLSKSSYFGDSRFRDAYGVAYDQSDFIYIAGETYVQEYGRNLFITKLDPSGTSIIYTTIIGGNENDYMNGIGVDSDGCAIVAGSTRSLDFPNINGTQGVRGGTDSFVIKVNQDGSSMIYSLLVCGTDADVVHSMTTDTQGNPYVSGLTRSSDFPQVGGLDNGVGGQSYYYSAFAFKLNSSTLALVYSFVIGSNGYVEAKDIAVNKDGYAAIVGRVLGSIPTTEGAVNQTSNGDNDAFVMRINPDGNSLNYSSYLGGSEQDEANAVAIDESGCVYVAGETFSIDFPTVNAFNATHSGSNDCFVTKFNSSGNSLLYSTLIGSPDWDNIFSIALDSNKNLIAIGCTGSEYFPLKEDYSSSIQGEDDVFCFKLNPSGNKLIFSTFIGGISWDTPFDVAISSTDSFIIVGSTHSLDFPMIDALDTTFTLPSVFFCIFDYIDLAGPPFITPPDRLQYYEAVPSSPLQWHLYDTYPSFYLLYEDGSLLGNYTWVDQSHIVNVDINDLTIGVYNYTIHAFDTDRNSTISSVLVSILELPPLLVEGPRDLDIEPNTSGYNITWNISSFEPVNYTVFRNSTAITKGYTTQSTFVLPLGGLSVGAYNFTIFVFNSQQECSDTVFAFVGQTTTNTTTTTTSTTSTTTETTTTTTSSTTNDTISASPTSNPQAVLLSQAVTISSIIVILVVSVMIIRSKRN